jgi:hypothetical protein
MHGHASAWLNHLVQRMLALRETMREVAAQWRRLAEDAEAEARFKK